MWIKLCGMTDEAAVERALSAAVDAIGFVFAPSVRQLDPARAAQLAAPARGRLSLVAVIRAPTQAQIDEILHHFRPDVLQSDLDDLQRLRLPRELSRLPVLRSGGALCGTLPRLLFEGPRSGSGIPTDWRQAAQLARQTQLILAGGLNPDNVAAAIDAVRPFGVDVSSGIESAPGRKSPEKMLQFVQAARAAFNGMSP